MRTTLLLGLFLMTAATTVGCASTEEVEEESVGQSADEIAVDDDPSGDADPDDPEDRVEVDASEDDDDAQVAASASGITTGDDASGPDVDGEVTATTQQAVTNNGVVWGISDQHGGFINPASNELKLLKKNRGLRTARFIVDSSKALGNPDFELFIRNAKANGFEPYVTVTFEGKVDPRKHAARVAKLVSSYGPGTPSGIKYWAAQNEPDNANASSFTYKRPAEAARYYIEAYRQVRAACRSCVLVAGEFAGVREASFSNKGAGGYIRRFQRALKKAGIRPKVWSFHPYGDILRNETKSTRLFIKNLRGSWGNPQIWLTEGGVRVDGRNSLVGRDAQRRGMELYLKLPTLSRRITRAYYYQLLDDNNPAWDSALLDVKGRPRPVFCALAAIPQTACTGQH